LDTILKPIVVKVNRVDVTDQRQGRILSSRIF
jgi:hypothetical protein